MTCYECVHCEACKRLLKAAFPSVADEEIEKTGSRDNNCINFKNKADVVEVVRCKDCKHWRHETDGMIEHYECNVFCGCYDRGYPTGADDFLQLRRQERNGGKRTVNEEQILQKLKSYRSMLTNQQYKVLRGQVLAGDIVGAEKGLRTLTRRVTRSVCASDKV